MAFSYFFATFLIISVTINTAMSSTKIGFIGLGIMGKGMLRNLVSKISVESSSSGIILRNGASESSQKPQYVIWNRSPDACLEIKNLFPDQITVASTASEVISTSDITFSMLSTMDASRDVFDAADGALTGVTSGKIIVDCATLSPERMVELNAAISSRGGCMLEAPVSGSKVKIKYIYD